VKKIDLALFIVNLTLSILKSKTCGKIHDRRNEKSSTLFEHEVECNRWL